MIPALKDLLARHRHHLPWLALLTLMLLIPFGGTLLTTTQVLSDRSTDVANQFLFSRAFGFGEIIRGNFPLWNPFTYSGIPYLGSFQSALLYPPNLLFLLLPLATAINASFVLHLWLFGFGTYLWAAMRRLQPAAAFLTGTAAMLSGTVLLHIYAGHLSNVCSLAWIPFLFLGIDQWLARRHAAWLAVAAFAVALQILGGHPQYVYFTALVAGLYTLVHLPGTPRLSIAAIGLLTIYPLGALLSAAQLIPGIMATQEAVRSSGVTYDFAAMFSFPPENLLTIILPWLFGNMQTVPYWGRCYLWEMSLYAGTGILILAVFGALGKKDRSAANRLLILLGAAILLALGAHTPLHKLLYNFLPGFGSFRGSSKFILFAGIFLSLFAGMGADRLLRKEKFPIALAAATAILGVILLVAAPAITTDTIRTIGAGILQTRESYLNPDAFEQAAFLDSTRNLAASQLRIAGTLFLLFAILFYFTNRFRRVIWVVGAVAVTELLVFARSTVVTFPLTDFTFPSVAEFLKKNPGDYRTLNLFNPDAAMLIRSENIWGYDPGVLKRYAELLFFSQGANPKTASQYLPLQRSHPVLSLLRGRYLMTPDKGEIRIQEIAQPFPRFFAVSNYEVLKDQDAQFRRMSETLFDWKRQILLETEPIPTPDSGLPKINISVKDFSTDHWTLDVKTDRATILVMTDSYSRDWRASAIRGSVQTNYSLLPANRAIRAIPLAAGHHQFRLDYIPTGWHLGIALSLLSLGACLAALSLPNFRRKLDFSTIAS